MIYILSIYMFIFIVVGLVDAKGVKNFDDYILAGKKSRSWIVGASLLATMIGASATMGIAGLAYSIGFPAIWWLGSGAFGLFMSSMFLVKKLGEYHVYSLADLTSKLFNEHIRHLVALIIVIGWIGVIAAQFVAGAKIIEGMTTLSFHASLFITAALIVAYCMFGGQKSVMKTDFLQLMVIFFGTALVIFYLAKQQPFSFGGDMALVNADFGYGKAAYFFLIVGAGYFIGPDIFSRVFTAQNPRSAKRGALAAAAILFIYGLAITMIGLWARYNIVDLGGKDVLTALLTQRVPFFVGAFFSVALFSAIISSADTCLMTVSAIITHDLMNIKKVVVARVVVVLFGAVAVIIALVNPRIIPNLLMAYNVFSCGIIPPVALALLQKRRLHTTPVIAAIVIGGTLGIVASITGNNTYAFTGMALSLTFSAGAVVLGSDVKSLAEPSVE